MGKEYERKNTLEDFVSIHERILPRILEVTKPGGSICWQVGYHVRDNKIIPLDFLVHQIMSKFSDLKLRNRIIWSFGHGAHPERRLSGRHEVVLWYTKGDNYYFDLNAIRIPQKYPGKRHYKGPKKGTLSGNPFGKNPSDVWDIPHVNANHKEKTSHPCQFPVGLVQRLIRALCPPEGLVLDPFAGSGTTAAAAVLEDRAFVGSEINHDYCDVAERRIVSASCGNLKYRDANIPIFKPDPRSKVARKPDHFVWSPGS